MSIDIMVVGRAEAIASRPGDRMLTWLETIFEDFEIRYGWICLHEGEAAELRRRFANDPVGAMLLEKVADLRSKGEEPPFLIELMIGA